MNYPVTPTIFAIREAVTKVSAELLADLKEYDSEITGVHFACGHWLELVEKKQKESNSPKQSTKNSRYPCVMVLEDIPIDRNYNGYWGRGNYTILIAKGTTPTWTSEQREINSFIPVINPIYEALIEAIANSPYFISNGMETHRMTDRKYLGRVQLNGNNGNKFTDFIDAKEITNLNLVINYENCMSAINILETN